VIFGVGFLIISPPLSLRRVSMVVSPNPSLEIRSSPSSPPSAPLPTYLRRLIPPFCYPNADHQEYTPSPSLPTSNHPPTEALVLCVVLSMLNARTQPPNLQKFTCPHARYTLRIVETPRDVVACSYVPFLVSNFSRRKSSLTPASFFML